MQPLKYAREPEVGERVRVYRNLHTGLISVQDMKGHVIKHVFRILLDGVQFVVRPAGRRKVLRTRKKNVHAFAVGRVIAFNEGFHYFYGQRRVKYNPYLYDSFVFADDPMRKVDIVSKAAVFASGVIETDPSFQVRGR